MPPPGGKFRDGKLLAILFADVVGYSALMQRDESDTYQRVTQSIGLLRTLVVDYGGDVIQVVGDGVLATFPSVDEALHFALEVQKEFPRDRVWNAGRPPIVFRIGISWGEVIVGPDCLHGHSVNLAARLQELADPGAICITAMVRQAIKDRSGLTLRSIGKPHLKNVEDPPEVFSVAPRDSEPPEALALPLKLEVPRVVPDSGLEAATVAVLPMDNLSGDPNDAHLCDGLVADIISNLSRFRNLMVIARHSVFMLKGRDLPISEVGRRLGVRYVLCGGLWRAGNRIRINVDLVEIESENTLWSERYNGAMEDIFDFQDEVATTTAARLAIHVDMAERRRIFALRAPDLRAYGLVLRGQDRAFRFVREQNVFARRLFQQALELDPLYGRCRAAISRTYNVEWRYDWTVKPETSLDKALDFANSAVDADALDARGYGEMGMSYLYKKRHEESVAAYERALELNPNDADLLAEMGDCLVYSRQAERAVDLVSKAIRLNPYHPDAYLIFLGDAFFHLGDYERTILTLLRMRDQSEGHRLLAASYALCGDFAEARRQGQQVLRAHPNFSIEHWRTVPPDKYPEDLDIFIDGLRKAGLT